MSRVGGRGAGPVEALALLIRGPARRRADHVASQSTSTIGLLAIDVASSGNIATSLGPVNGYARVEPGSTTSMWAMLWTRSLKIGP